MVQADDILARLLGSGPPLQTTAWTLRDSALAVVLSMLENGRRTVVECGSGRSTVLLARCLREYGEGSVHSLEHDPCWAAATRARLAGEDLSAWATVVDAPLEPHPRAIDGGRWYAGRALDKLPRHGVDVLLVDGPPGNEPSIALSRYPALPALRSRLAPGARIILDDADRPGERWVVDRWEAETGARFERLDEEGVAICVFSAPQGGNSISREV